MPIVEKVNVRKKKIYLPKEYKIYSNDDDIEINISGISDKEPEDLSIRLNIFCAFNGQVKFEDIWIDPMNPILPKEILDKMERIRYIAIFTVNSIGSESINTRVVLNNERAGI